jgi:hypothetical protein
MIDTNFCTKRERECVCFACMARKRETDKIDKNATRISKEGSVCETSRPALRQWTTRKQMNHHHVSFVLCLADIFLPPKFFPQSSLQPYYLLVTLLHAFTIAMQWFVHVSAVLYLLTPNPGPLPKRVILHGTFGALLLLTIWTIGVSLGRAGCSVPMLFVIAFVAWRSSFDLSLF